MIDLYYAEDDVQIAEAVKAYLGQKDYRVTIYPTLSEMEKALSRQLPALVLLDWNMPDGQGRICAA